MAGIANHLWQSTVFGVVCWLLTLALRKNRAAVRYWIWLAASLKFLVPFALLVSAGSRVDLRPASAVSRSRVPVVVTQLHEPFVVTDERAPRSPVLPRTLALLWMAGALVGVIFWARCIRDMRKLARAARPLPLDLPIPVMVSPERLEPGVFGILKPVLILPEGITGRLTAAQMDAIVAHELCHARRRDNLTGAIHMVVEILFWFHPLVWWIRRQLVAERERACDEAAVSATADPEVYAEGILTVCRFYLESPTVCVSGVTGAELKTRIAEILTRRAGMRLSVARWMLLSAAALVALAIPLAIGVLHAQAALPTFDVVSVKPVDQPWLQVRPARSGGRITWTTDLGYLIGYAWRMQPFRISGPVPGSSSIYRVDVSTDPGASEEQVRLMFRSLLADRFHMASHLVQKESDGYLLTVGKTGMKLKEAKPGDPPPALPETFRGGKSSVSDFEGVIAATIPEGGVINIIGRRVTMFQLSESLQRVMQTAVWDETGLPGTYYFQLRYAREDNPTVTDLPTLAEVLQRDMGLKLEKHKGPIEMLVVDSIDKTPTGN